MLIYFVRLLPCLDSPCKGGLHVHSVPGISNRCSQYTIAPFTRTKPGYFKPD